MPIMCGDGTAFQHTAARRRLALTTGRWCCRCRNFNTQPPEGGWIISPTRLCQLLRFQHTAARRRLARCRRNARRGGGHFNTQPPEGGWHVQPPQKYRPISFQHTAARRRLGNQPDRPIHGDKFQHTAARRRLVNYSSPSGWLKNFNTQPPEGGWVVFPCSRHIVSMISTHSRPKAAGFAIYYCFRQKLFQHTAARRRLAKPTTIKAAPSYFNTQPPEGGWGSKRSAQSLGINFNTQPPEGGWFWLRDRQYQPAQISTHSRPKAAGKYSINTVRFQHNFNTQPPEGGWIKVTSKLTATLKFQHTAARRRLEPLLKALLRQVSQPRFR